MLPVTIRYKIKPLDLSSQLLQIEAEFIVSHPGDIIVNLPAWRPGRYELQDFAKKVTNFVAFDSLNQSLKVEKINKHSWKVFNVKTGVKISYKYYADVLDAGNGCYFNQELVYINPCTCLVYTLDSLAVKTEIELEADTSWKFSTSLDRLASKEAFIFEAEDFHKLADSPILLSPVLQQLSFAVDLANSQDQGFKNCQVSLNVFSRLNVDLIKLKEDFEKFIYEQAKIFGSFPYDKYEFQIILTPHETFHGVEHFKSTVVCLGPDENIFEPQNQLEDKPKVPTYKDLLVVCCHEFFHFWNVKAFRPKEFINLDYSKECFSSLHYITEGVTSFYEDLILLRAGLINNQKYYQGLTKYWQYYADNSKFSHLSLAQSSFESWLDGYSTTTPHRANSFYVTGKLVALILDVKIKQATQNQNSLDDLMKQLYQNFSGSKGYTRENILDILFKISGLDFGQFFEDYIYSTIDLEKVFVESLSYLGLKIIKSPNPGFISSKLGIKLFDKTLKIKQIHPNQKLPLMVGDTLLNAGDTILKQDAINEVFGSLGPKFNLKVLRLGKNIDLLVNISSQEYYQINKIEAAK
ncbi:MAG: hypothetical protein WCK98_00385 [bacterium]